MQAFFPMDGSFGAPGSLEAVASRLAALLSGEGGGLRDPERGDLVFEDTLDLRPLSRTGAPGDVWAVDGGQATVADARCLQVCVTRASVVRWRDGRTALEEEGALRAHLLGLGEDRRTLASLGAPVDPDASVDVNLLRDWGEWEAVESCVDRASPGAMVLVDGDLQPDWRVRSSWLASLFARASSRRVDLVGVTKHTSLSRGGAPLLGQLEALASGAFGPRPMWWVPVARTRADVEPGIQVVVAQLDPDARFSFRMDLPAAASPEGVLGALSALSDDAAFPGYPYPLSAADRLAACPDWLRNDVWGQIDELLRQAGTPLEVRERAFTDRHRMMERS